MRELMTAAKAKQEEDEETYTFLLDGEEYTTFKPTEEQLVFLVAAQTGGYTTDNERVAAIINFFCGLFDSDSHARIVRRLLDRDDPFAFTAEDEESASVMSILEMLIEVWTGNPTSPSSASTPSRKNAGTSSRANASVKARTPSQRRLAASAT